MFGRVRINEFDQSKKFKLVNRNGLRSKMIIFKCLDLNTYRLTAFAGQYLYGKLPAQGVWQSGQTEVQTETKFRKHNDHTRLLS